MSTWFKLATDAWHDSKILELPSDFTRWSWIVLLSLAKEKDGTFDSEAQLRKLMGVRYRSVRSFRKVGLMDGLSIHNWDVYQSNPDRSAERMRRLRLRRAGGSDNGRTEVESGSNIDRATVESKVSQFKNPKSDASCDGVERELERERELEQEKEQAEKEAEPRPRRDEEQCWDWLEEHHMPLADRRGFLDSLRKEGDRRTGGLRSLDAWALKRPKPGIVHLLEQRWREMKEDARLRQHEARKNAPVPVEVLNLIGDHFSMDKEGEHS